MEIEIETRSKGQQRYNNQIIRKLREMSCGNRDGDRDQNKIERATTTQQSNYNRKLREMKCGNRDGGRDQNEIGMTWRWRWNY